MGEDIEVKGCQALHKAQWHNISQINLCTYFVIERTMRLASKATPLSEAAIGIYSVNQSTKRNDDDPSSLTIAYHIVIYHNLLPFYSLLYIISHVPESYLI